MRVAKECQRLPEPLDDRPIGFALIVLGLVLALALVAAPIVNTAMGGQY